MENLYKNVPIHMIAPIRILIIDQHDVVRERLAVRLEREPGIDVLARIRQDEVDLLEENDISPNIILLDPLDYKSGARENLEKVIDIFPEAAIVILTAVVDTFAEVEYRKLGISSWLTKGIDSNKLIAELREIALPLINVPSRTGHLSL